MFMVVQTVEPSKRVPGVILENGVVRTMAPTLPVVRALAIAGDRIAGGVGDARDGAREPRRASTWAAAVSCRG